MPGGDVVSSPGILLRSLAGSEDVVAGPAAGAAQHKFVVAAASNNTAILDANLRRSPAIADGVLPLHVEHNARSATLAYNAALDATDADVIIFTHHDVYLPRGWETLLKARIAEVERMDPKWAVLGAFGVANDGTTFGPVWSTSLGSIVGRVSAEPVAVQSFDELLIVLRRASGVRFDPALPGFHLYGTDVAQTARQRGLGAYVVPIPVVHNDGYKDQLDGAFGAAYRFIQRKWRADLPVRSPILTISSHGLHLVKTRLAILRDRANRRALAQPVEVDPRTYAALCGWNDLTYVGEPR
jgi:hypothetical protein